MSVPRDEIDRIARLASLSIEPESFATLAKQVNDILEYVAQLEEVDEGDDAAASRIGPTTAPLRPDEVRQADMMRAPEEIAPTFTDGLFVVPKVSGVGGDA